MPTHRETTPGRGISPLLVLAIIVGVAAVGLGGVLAWQRIGTNALAAGPAAESVAALRAGWADATTGSPAEGEPVVVDRPEADEPAWVLRIPAISLEYPVVSGVEPGDLSRGVGWYPGSALPGQVGNMALAGQRITHGEPFGRLLELRVGDEVIVETAHAVFTYTLISAPADLSVRSDESWVLDPVPGRPDEIPTRAFLTLTTAEDLVATDDRAVGFATLTTTETR